MERLEFSIEKWVPDENAPLKAAGKLLLSDYQGEEKECWHLRGRAWRWVTLRSYYSINPEKQEYELSFWAKFDYYSGRGTRCYIDLLCGSSKWEERLSYDIRPDCPNAVARSGDWVLYKFPIKIANGRDLMAQVIAFEANIALMPAFPGDENKAGVTPVQPGGDKVFTVFNELPFKEYASLEQRIVKYYSDMLAPFYPVKDITEKSQKEYYEFINGLYDRLFAKPENFFKELHEDDAFPNRFSISDYGKPHLKVHMKKDQEKLQEIFILLAELGKTGEALEDGIHITFDLSIKQKKLLDFMGFEVNESTLQHNDYKNIGEAIVYLAKKENALTALMYCWFDETYPYLEKTYEKHYDKEHYNLLTGWLKEHGYQISIGQGTSPTLDYYKSINEKEHPVGYAMHGDKFHYGFTFEYRLEPRVRQHCEPRILQFAEMLKRFDEQSEATKELILQRTKHCDKCRYCVQTDKTGKRPYAAIKMNDGTDLCPYYPGFNLTFERLTNYEVDHIIAFLSDLEKLVLSNMD